MDPIPLGLVLIVVVVCVLAATHPDGSRRRTRSSSAYRRKPLSNRVHKQSDKGPAARTGIYRNRWDRADLARGVGRDYADVEGSVNWQGGTLTPRS